MRALCLDLGTSTGYAILDGEEIVESGEWDMPGSSEPMGSRWVSWDNWVITRTLRTTIPDAVVFEVPMGIRYLNALKIQLGQIALLEMRAERAGMEYAGVRPQDIKKIATGKGNAGKELMKQALFERAEELGLPEPDPEIGENEVDAIWVAVYARDVLARDADGAGA